MRTDSPQFDETIIQQLDKTLGHSRAADKTISDNPPSPEALAQSSLADRVRRLGYEMGRELGRGGLGVVSIATQSVFDREVAIKQLLSNESNRDDALQFFAEALIAAQLEHPHIVPIHDLMANADGQLQLVMKKVDGLSWKDILHPHTQRQKDRADQLKLDDHLDILLKVCDAMSFAHEKGILHRDLKPENVMIGNYGEVLVMDWGCAVAFGERNHHPVVPRVEEIRSIAGTPCYMAPEMVLVKPDFIGPHSDVYLLGAILYELLTGKRPHHGADVYAVLKDVVRGTVTSPQDAAPDRNIPEELADIAMGALVKSPGKRIRSVADFANRIKAYRRHAQAVALVNAVRSHLGHAKTKTRHAAEHLRKAVSGAEQALEIWPEWETAKGILLEAVFADAKHHLAEGAASLAVTEASRASVLARDLDNKVLLNEAKELANQARSAASAQASRQQQVRNARLASIAAGFLLVIGLIIFVFILQNQQSETAEALKKAETALAALKEEQQGRSGDQQTSAPALVVKAKLSMAFKQWDNAIASLKTAVEFDPELIEAHQLLTNLLAVTKQFDAVQEAGAAWQKAAGGDPIAHRILTICRVLKENTDPIKSTESQVILVELLEQQKLYTLAELVHIPNSVRLEAYRKRIESIWAGTSSVISMREDGKLSTEYQYGNGNNGFRGKKGHH